MYSIGWGWKTGLEAVTKFFTWRVDSRNANFHKNFKTIPENVEMCIILSSKVCYAVVPDQPTPRNCISSKISVDNFSRF